MRRPQESKPDPKSTEREHGSHTLKVWEGTVVGRNRDDVFVELGDRMQGVISAREFEPEPRVGETYEFTLRGREETLWVLALRDGRSLATWETMEVGSLVHARIIRKNPGGLEVKIGPLHAFLPRSQTGLPREKDPEQLVGKTLPCEVIEIDAERQRVMVSRKVVLRRERESDVHRKVAGLKAGQVVQGRVTRVEDYGAFLRFGTGLEGLIHISNLAHDRLSHPSEVVKVGDRIEAKVLYVNRGGKRIALGIKQLDESPWTEFARSHVRDGIVAGTVTRIADFGAFVRVARGVEGLVHRSEMDLPTDKSVRQVLLEGQPVSVRVIEIEEEEERLALSLFHRDGSRIGEDEAEAVHHLATAGEGVLDGVLDAGPTNTLGNLLAKALREKERADDQGV